MKPILKMVLVLVSELSSNFFPVGGQQNISQTKSQNQYRKIHQKFPGLFMNTSGPMGRSAAPGGGGLTDKLTDKFIEYWTI
jgi:hypothetical protein